MTEMLPISRQLAIPIDEIELSAIRARGAGGQNVNKVASAVHLRFDSHTLSLPSGNDRPESGMLPKRNWRSSSVAAFNGRLNMQTAYTQNFVQSRVW